ncbi:MAG: hypothetical protein Q4G43_17705 [Mobilicoccus sp.]|nr:hypothetical protein [Mobilicoccus sp.]
MNTIQKIGLTIGTGALALGGVAGIATLANAADPTASPTTPAASSDAPGTTSDARGDRGDHGGREGRGGPGGKGGMMRGADAAALAEKLGVDEAKVTEALKTAHDALHAARDAASDSTTKPDPAERKAQLATELAKALGIDEAKVTEALTTLETERNAERATQLQTRLDQAVTDGTLTQAEADAVKKAVEAGVIGGGPGGPGGRR